jgi:hypothetical protein
MHDLTYDPCPFIFEGSRVEIVAGPLCGLVGRLLRKDLRRSTVLLSVNLIQQGIHVEVNAIDILPFDAAEC